MTDHRDRKAIKKFKSYSNVWFLSKCQSSLKSYPLCIIGKVIQRHICTDIYIERRGYRELKFHLHSRKPRDFALVTVIMKCGISNFLKFQFIINILISEVHSISGTAQFPSKFVSMIYCTKNILLECIFSSFLHCASMLIIYGEIKH